MRRLVTLLLVCTCASCANFIDEKPYGLNGTWLPQSEELAGTPLPATAFKNIILTITDGNYTVTATGVDRGMISYSHGKMDIYGSQGVNAGQHFMAIYKVDGDLLTICYDLSGLGYPADYATKGHANYLLFVYKKS